VSPLDGLRVEAAAVRALVDDEQHAQFGIVVFVDDSERRAGNGIVIEFVTRVAKAVLRILAR
jgi:hypothetical protein